MRRYSDDFEKLWKLWSEKKRGRIDHKYPAFLKYQNLNKYAPDDVFRLFLYIEAVDFEGIDIKYIPHLKTIISQRRWDGVCIDSLTKQKQMNIKRKKGFFEFEKILYFIQKWGCLSTGCIGLTESGQKALCELGGRQIVGMTKVGDIPKVREKYIDLYLKYS